MRRAGLAVVVVAVLTAAGCTAVSAPSARRSAARSSPAGSFSQHPAVARCPVTRPLLHAAPPAQMGASPPLPVPYIHGWYGNQALWVGVPPGGVLPARRDPGTRDWSTKFPWWRVLHGTLTIVARRLDGPSAGFRGEVPGGYGSFGFVPSGLVWPSPGCWRVTGTVARHSLTIVMRVQVHG